MEIEPNARKSTLQICISIALFVLLIACISYINISTATASGRRKEIGLRKTIGASGIRIKIRYLNESILTALISFIIALVLTILFLPVMNSITGIDLKVGDLFEGGLVFFNIGFVILVGLLAGIYPAAMLSSFNPIVELTQKNSTGKQKIYFRQVFVAIQFALSLILVIGTIIIYRQLNFMKKQSLGFDKDHVLILPFNYPEKVTRQCEILKRKLLKNPGIKYVTESGDIPGKMATTMFFWAADPVNFLHGDADT
jgi:putative ABC transport system permease protein